LIKYTDGNPLAFSIRPFPGFGKGRFFVGNIMILIGKLINPFIVVIIRIKKGEAGLKYIYKGKPFNG